MDEARRAEATFDGIGLGTLLPRSGGSGALATSSEGSFRFATLVTVATDSDGSPGSRPPACRATDPEGIDLALGDLTARAIFPQPVEGPGSLRRVLEQMEDQARKME